MARHETEALWGFASDELEEGARVRVAEHLADCEACTQKLAEVRQAQLLVRSAREETPEVRWAEVDDRIQTAAARRFARLERPRWPWALVTAGAVAALLAFVVLRPVTAPPPSTIVAPSVATRDVPPAPPTPEVPEAPSPTEAPVLAAAAQVESATGAWIREGGAAEHALQKGSKLRAGASVRTPKKSSALLRLPDASRVRLSPESEVTLARTAAEDVHLTVTKGRLAVRASHVARRGFTVEAAGVRAFVVGTVFSVERTARGAVVAVLEGKVRVEAEGQPARFVSAGERLEVGPGEPQARTLSAHDRQAFQELPPEESASLPRPAAGSPSRPREPAPALAVAPAVPESPAVEAPEPESAPVPSPLPVEGPAPVPEETGSEFAPYPVPTGEEPTGRPVVVAPSPASGPALADSGATDARFLSHAQEQLNSTTCESFLVGLAEIAERSQSRDLREQARYLRARCFEERLARSAAKAEYRRYLREFPRGRYVREARTALLPW